MHADPDASTLFADSEAERVVLGSRYELLGLLGAGGMGNVYKARDRELDDLVALKVLRPELVGAPGALERFRREVKLARRVTHPNVARVFDIGELGNDKILTMELVDGETLSALLGRVGALSVRRALEVALAVCAGVGAAHAAGVVHRDLKPDNVLLSRDGRVVVSDFGIARAAGGGDAARTGGILGTPAYMAPEQVEGRPDVDERADVYAFGGLLYEMLTGEPPWRGDSVFAIAAARLLHPPPDPRALRPALDVRVAEATLRCLARHPADRFPSMGAVAAALAEVASASTGPEAARSTAPRANFDRPARRGDKRVAVLPFRNLGAPDEEYLADGLTEDLIDRLSLARGLRVQSRGVVMRHKGEARDPREIGRELGVEVVVEGSVRRAQGAFRITARVVSVADGFQLWVQRFEGAEAELLAANDQVAQAVASALTVDLASDERRGRHADAEAVDLYLRARAAYHRFFSGDVQVAIDLFERALARTPDDPRVIAGYVMSRTRSPVTTGGSGPELRAEAERALDLAPSLPDAHVAQGTVLFHFGDAPEAVRSARRALRLTSTCAEAHDLLGRILCEADCDDGVRHLERALVLEPIFEFSKSSLARHHALRGNWEAAEGVMDREEIPSQARLVFWLRDAAAAERMLARIPGGAPRRPIHAIVRALLEVTAHGRTPPPDLLVKTADAKPRVAAFLLQILTEIAATLGQSDVALTELEACVDRGVFDLAWFDRCPALESLRAAPQFAPLRARVAARAAEVVAAYVEPLSD